MTWQGVHWLTGTCALPPQKVADIVSRHMCGLHLEPIERGMWTYTRSYLEVTTKARVLWGGKHLEVCVNLTGEACELLGTEGVRDLARELGLKLTRLDVAWDTDLVTPGEVRAAHVAANAVTFS